MPRRTPTMWPRSTLRLTSMVLASGSSRILARVNRSTRRPRLEVLEARHLLSGSGSSPFDFGPSNDGAVTSTGFHAPAINIQASSVVANAGPDQTSNEGASVMFLGTASGAGSLSYQWTFGDGGTAIGTLTPSHVYANKGSYSATLK